MLSYEASGANYSLWEFESAGSRSARDNFWDVNVEAQHGGTDFLSFFWLVPPFCLPLSEFKGEAIREKASESGCSPCSSQTASFLPSSFQQSFQDSLNHYSSTFYCAKHHRFPWQQRLTYFFLIILYVYMCVCVLPAAVIFFTSWREVRTGQDLLQVLQGALSAAGKHFTLSTSDCP